MQNVPRRRLIGEIPAYQKELAMRAPHISRTAGSVLILLSILSVPAMATTMYTIDFTTSSGVAPTSGSFNYDATNGLSNFLVAWNGITYDETTSANTVPDGTPEIVFGLARPELCFAVLSQTLSEATSYYWVATDPGGAVSYNYFDFYALTSSTPVIIDGERPPTHLPFVTTGTGPTWQITAVPEPASLTMVAVGALAWLTWASSRRCRRRGHRRMSLPNTRETPHPSAARRHSQ
jgi:hypothetical protein